MALDSVLSALRQVILDTPGQLPAEYEQRRAFFRSLQPCLSEDELSDLAKIPPERFGIYTGTIFRGEANVIRSHYPVSIVILHRLMQDKFDLVSLVQQAHHYSPWKSISSLDLLSNFASYIAQKPELPSYLAELMQLERSVLQLRRWPEERGVATDSDVPRLDAKDLAALTLDQLLEGTFQIAEVRISLDCRYDVLSLMRSYYSSPKEFAVRPMEEQPTRLLGSRTDSNRVCWTRLGLQTFTLLSKAKPNQRLELYHLCECVLEDSEVSTEAEQAEEFVSKVAELFSHGAINLARSVPAIAESH